MAFSITFLMCLTIRRLLLEKIPGICRRRQSFGGPVPTRRRGAAEKTVSGARFHGEGATGKSGPAEAVTFVVYQSCSCLQHFKTIKARSYQITSTYGKRDFVDNDKFDYTNAGWSSKWTAPKGREQNIRARGGKRVSLLNAEDWQPGRASNFAGDRALTPGEKQVRSLTFARRIPSRGPMEEKYWVRPKIMNVSSERFP